jgi:hypothetical protein
MKADPSQNIPTASSTSESWIQWHKELKRVFGKKTANSLWSFAWAKRGGKNADANTSKTRMYMKSQGVNIDTTKLNEAFDNVKASINQGISVAKWVAIGGLGIGLIIFILILRKLLQNPSASIPNVIVPNIPKQA